jgi:hypothetical protein
VVTGQVAVVVSVTKSVLQAPLPVAVTVVVTEQTALAGTVDWPVKLAEAPGAREATVLAKLSGA